MYIRRKVFSLLQDETGEERYFSTTDVTLEDVEERIFSINEYEEDFEERDFSEDESHLGRNIALGTSAALAAGAGTLYAAKKGKLGLKAAMRTNRAIMNHTKSGSKLYEGAVKDIMNTEKASGRAAAKVAEKLAKKGVDKNTARNIVDDTQKEVKSKLEKLLRRASPGVEKNISDKIAETNAYKYANRAKRKVNVVSYKAKKKAKEVAEKVKDVTKKTSKKD